jgi:hypothetical protein
MECKIRIRVGNIEVEYEGAEAYLKNDLPNLIEYLAGLPVGDEPAAEPEEEEVLPPTSDLSKKKLELTTNSIAGMLNAKSGPDLVLAACAHLHLVKGAETFHRKNILAEMRSANNYFTRSSAGNFSKSLSSLVKDRKLMERTEDTYALDAKTLSELQKILAP